MKQYLVFAGLHYHPLGGWNDFIDSFDDLKAARMVALSHVRTQSTWSHIVDLEATIPATIEEFNGPL
jgi:hypothetical protein